jgi:uncharacterized protein (TIGR02270 family)
MLVPIPKPASEDAFILWDVLAEHLDEAGFLWTQWEHALKSPLYTLDQVERIFEERMLAHLDGLVVGGEGVAEKMLWPAIQQGSAEEVFASAFALLKGLTAPSRQKARAYESILERLLGQPCRHFLSLWRAFELATPSEGAPLLERLLRQGEGHRRIAAMRGLAGLNSLPAGVLPMLLLDSDAAVANTALSLIGMTADSPSTLAAPMRAQLRAATPNAMWLRAAAILQLPDVWEYCRNPQDLSAEAVSMALSLCAISGEKRLHAVLCEALDQPTLAREAVFALGFSGKREDVARCLELTRGPLAPLAAEVIVGITGVDLTAERLIAASVPAKEPSDEALAHDRDHDFTLRPEQELPSPAPEALDIWWQANRSQFFPEVRYLHGLPDEGVSTLLRLLSFAPMRRRPTLSLELALRSSERPILMTQSLARAQRRRLATMAACTAQASGGARAC